MDTKITAVIPTCQRPHFLKRSVRSILNQTHQDLKILVVDNASGDETPQIADLDPRIRVHTQKKRVGIAENFQTGLDLVDTPYLIFLPDDDFVAPSLFEDALEKFAQYPDIAFCGGGGLNFDSDFRFARCHPVIGIPEEGYYPCPEGFWAYINSGFGICFPSIVFKTKALRDLDGIDPRLKNGLDEELISKCAAKHPIYLLTHSDHYFGCQHPGQLTKATDYVMYENDCKVLASRLIPLVPESRSFFENRLLDIWMRAYKENEGKKRYQVAHKYAKKVYDKTGDRRWKRREKRMNYPPFVIRALNQLKDWESRFRKRKEVKKSKPVVYHPDSERWKAYAKELER